MKKLFLFLVTIATSISVSFAQGENYAFIDAQNVSSDVIRVTLNTMCGKKKNVDYEAQVAAIRIVLFDGTNLNQYRNPLLREGEQTTLEKHNYYLQQLYQRRYSDFVKSFKRKSKFKKAEGKATTYEVEIYIIKLKRDLESNNIKNTLTL